MNTKFCLHRIPNARIVFAACDMNGAAYRLERNMYPNEAEDARFCKYFLQR